MLPKPNIASSVTGLATVLLALIRTLEESENLKRTDLVNVLKEFQRDMSPTDLANEGVVVSLFLKLLDEGPLKPTSLH